MLRVLAAFAALVGLVWLVAWWSVLHPPASAPYGATFVNDLPAMFRGWAHWDSSWYAGIASTGYSYRPGAQSAVAFSPSYPLVIRGVLAFAPSGTSPFATGSIVTLASGLAAVALLWRWCLDQFGTTTQGRRVAAASVLCLAVYPYSIYLYGPVYADALFLAGALGAFVLLERDHMWAAALVAAIASGARPVGPFLAVALVARAAERRYLERATPSGYTNAFRREMDRFDLRRLARRDLVLFGGAAGFVGYCIYLGARFGEPFAFASVQSAPGWDQGAGPSTWFKVAFFAELRRDPFGPASLGLMLQLAFAVLTICMVPGIARRFGHAYALFVILLVALPMIATKDFQGFGRYLLPAFPATALAGSFVAQRPHRSLVLAAVGVPVLLLFASWFAKGNYLA